MEHNGNYKSYYYKAKSDYEEPLTTHADHFNTNTGYSISAYSKGCVFVSQLGYIVGDKVRDKIMLEYYKRWRFKHPNANDFVQVAQDVSGIQLDWYKEYWTHTTKKIDYAIDSLWEENNVTKLRIRRIGQLPMPIDIVLTKKDGSKEYHTIPLNLMFGAKKEDEGIKPIVHEEWRWTHPTFVIETKTALRDFIKIEIDPTQRMADVDRRNNDLEFNF